MNPCGTFARSYKEDSAIIRTRMQWFLTIASLIILFSLPFFINEYWASFLNRVGIVLIAVLGVNIVTGYCGQINIGQAAFMAVGAYTSAILVGTYGVPFWLAIVCAGVISAGVGLIFGVPSLKVKGFYLAISTLAAQFIIIWIILRLKWLTGGENGYLTPKASLGGIVFDTDIKLFYLVMSITVFLLYFAKNLARSRFGRAFIAIRDNDLSAEVMGINLAYYKTLAFAISAFYGGIAGSLWAHSAVGINIDYFTLMDSIWYLAIIIIGGMGSILGAVLGTVFMELLNLGVTVVTPALTSLWVGLPGPIWASLGRAMFGLVIILFLIFEPRGLAHRWEIVKRTYRLWPFPY